MGNTVIWKPSDSQTYSAKIIMDLLKEAGLPKGVINLIHCKPEDANKVILNSPEFAGLHLQDQQKFLNLYGKKLGKIFLSNTSSRIVGETGEKIL